MMNQTNGWMNGWSGGGTGLWSAIGLVVVALLAVVVWKQFKK